MYEMWNLKYPIVGTSIHNLLLRICSESRLPETTTIYSRDLRDLIKKMLTFNASNRPDINEIFESELVQNALFSFFLR